MGKQINVGVVGFGKMGVLHSGILNTLADCKVVAICETEPLIRKLASRAFPQARFYESPFDMVMQANLDAVYVTTPIASHLSVINEIARSGKRLGIFIEKPLARTTQEAQRIIEATSKFAACDMVGFQKRFLSQFGLAKQLLEKGALGRVNYFRGHSYLGSVFSKGHGWRFRKGEGGALLDLGPHIIDLVVWYFGAPSSVNAKESSIYSEEVEDFAAVDFGFDTGLSGQIEVSWSKEGYRLPEIGMEIVGSNGTLRVSDDALEFVLEREVLNLAKAGRSFFTRPELLSGVEFLLGDPEYCLEDGHFLSSLREGKPPIPNLYDGLEVNRIIDSAHASAARR